MLFPIGREEKRFKKRFKKNDIRTATLSKAAYQIVPGGKRRVLNERMTCNAGLND
jgi:hypothetical protein